MRALALSSSQHAIARCVHRQAGLTLVELMVGMTLGLLLVGGLLTLVAHTSNSERDLARAMVQIEDARFTSELLQEDLRVAGFVGELPLTGVSYVPGTADPYTVINPCSVAPAGAFSYDSSSAQPLKVPAAVQGYAANQTLSCLSNRLAGTDALVVRRLATTTTPVSAVASGNQQYYVQYSYCESDPAVKLVFDKDASAFTLRNRACSGTNPLRAYVTRIYFVASCNVCGTDTIPTLKRMDLVNGELVETALVEGVETLRFEYGFDTNADGSTDTYLASLGDSTSATGSWGNVTTLKAHFVMRSADKATGTGLSNEQRFQFGGLDPIDTTADGYVRHGYSTVIHLINPSTAREGA